MPLIVYYQARALLKRALARLAVSLLKCALEDSLELGPVTTLDALSVAINLNAHFLVGRTRKNFETGVCLLSGGLHGLNLNLGILSLRGLRTNLKAFQDAKLVTFAHYLLTYVFRATVVV